MGKDSSVSPVSAAADPDRFLALRSAANLSLRFKAADSKVPTSPVDITVPVRCGKGSTSVAVTVNGRQTEDERDFCGFPDPTSVFLSLSFNVLTLSQSVVTNI